MPGDFIETGVWRGGTTILMRGVLEAMGDRERSVWVADSFEGLPVPDAEQYPADTGLDWSHVEVLKVGADAVRANFERYGLLDDRVRFLEGWFCDTLPDAPIEQLSVLRLDGDLYQSTMDALVALEPKVSPGGFVLVDDYGGWPPCRAAVDDYRAERGIAEPIHAGRLDRHLVAQGRLAHEPRRRAPATEVTTSKPSQVAQPRPGCGGAAPIRGRSG